MFITKCKTSCAQIQSPAYTHAVGRLLESAQPNETDATGTVLLKLDDFPLTMSHISGSGSIMILLQPSLGSYYKEQRQTSSSIQVEDLLQNLRQAYEAAPPHKQVCPSLIDSAIIVNDVCTNRYMAGCNLAHDIKHGNRTEWNFGDSKSSQCKDSRRTQTMRKCEICMETGHDRRNCARNVRIATAHCK
jgi:hypothetical protein